MASYDWTRERVEMLTELWDDGVPTAEIGRRMGISKGAVIGKAFRLALRARPKPANLSRGVVSRPAARSNRELPVSETRAASLSRQRAAYVSGVSSSAVERQASSRPERNLPGAGADEAPRRVFSDKQCQFLYGETRGAYRFCDAPCVASDTGKASAFCATHYDLCLIPVKKADAARKALLQAGRLKPMPGIDTWRWG